VIKPWTSATDDQWDLVVPKAEIGSDAVMSVALLCRTQWAPQFSELQLSLSLGWAAPSSDSLRAWQSHAGSLHTPFKTDHGPPPCQP